MSGVALEQFLGDLTRWQDQVREKADLFPKAVAQTVFTEVSSGGKYGPGTPIDLGHARASWDGGIGAIPNNPAAGSEAEAQSRTLAAIQAAKAGDVIYLANNAPYILRLEFGFVGEDSLGRYYVGFGPKSVNGRSSQAPNGFVRIVLAQAQAIVDEVGAFLAGTLRKARITGKI